MTKSDESLAALIRRCRGTRSQMDFAAAIGVRQSTLSSWERGTKLPSEGQLERIAKAANRGKVDLEVAWKRAATLLRAPRHSIGRVLFEEQEYMERFGYPAAIWVVGPQYLSVLDHMDVRRRWRELLEFGVDYRLLWFLDLVTADQLHASVGILNNLAKGIVPHVNRSLGKVIHYATCAYSEPDESTLRFYNDLRKTVHLPPGASKPSAMVAHPFRTTAKDENLFCAITSILKMWHPQTTVVLCKYPHFAPTPIANVQLMPLRETLNDDAGDRLIYWLSLRDAAAFDRVIGDVESAFGGIFAGREP